MVGIQMEGPCETIVLLISRDVLSKPWGFRIQGGSDTGFPLAIQRVFSGSPAEGILQRGDIIDRVEQYDASNMRHKDAQDLVRVAGLQLNFQIKRYRVPPALPQRSAGHSAPSTRHTRPPVPSVPRHQHHPSLQTSTGTPMYGQFGVQYSRPPPRVATDGYDRNAFSQTHTPRGGPNPYSEQDVLRRVQDSLSKLTGSGYDEQFSPDPKQSTYSSRTLGSNPNLSHPGFSSEDQRSPTSFGWSPSPEKLFQARQSSRNSTAGWTTISRSSITPRPQYQHQNMSGSSTSSNSATFISGGGSLPNRRYSTNTMGSTNWNHQPIRVIVNNNVTQQFPSQQYTNFHTQHQWGSDVSSGLQHQPPVPQRSTSVASYNSKISLPKYHHTGEGGVFDWNQSNVYRVIQNQSSTANQNSPQTTAVPLTPIPPRSILRNPSATSSASPWIQNRVPQAWGAASTPVRTSMGSGSDF